LPRVVPRTGASGSSGGSGEAGCRERPERRARSPLADDAGWCAALGRARTEVGSGRRRGRRGWCVVLAVSELLREIGDLGVAGRDLRLKRRDLLEIGGVLLLRRREGGV